MTSELLNRIYNSAPYAVQSFLFNRYTSALKRSRYSGDFQELSRSYSETEHFSIEQIENWQLERLRNLLIHAADHVPYYSKSFKEIGFVPNDLTELTDISELPILTKQKVRDNFDSLQSNLNRKNSLKSGHTSGTTGTPLDIVYDRQTVLATDVLDWRQKRWAGVSPSETHAYILGRTIVHPGRRVPPFWQFDRAMNNLWISAFHLADSHGKAIIEAIRKYNVSSIEGYPSTLSTLAQIIQKTGSVLPMKAAFTSSETLYEWQKDIIQHAFQCKLFDFYGLAERVAFATECAAQHRKHLNFELSLNEITDSKGNSLPDGELGLLTGTTLTNFAMPLIRYQTSDMTAINPEPCECGLSMRTINDVETKAEDLVRTPAGKYISPSVLTHPFKTVSGLEKSQIIQTAIDRLVVKLVPSERIGESELTTLRTALLDRLGNDMTIHFEIVEQIESGPNAKFRWVISDIKN